MGAWLPFRAGLAWQHLIHIGGFCFLFAPRTLWFGVIRSLFLSDMNFSIGLNRLRDKLFAQIHQNNLVYNTCWEDPRQDRIMMQIQPDSKIVMITSAGCNALDYLLDSPEAVHTIDVNPRQNALLELKRALFRNASHDELFGIFGNGRDQRAEAIFHDLLKKDLPAYPQKYWSEKIKWFTSDRRGFYFRGTSGMFAWLFKQYLDNRREARKMLNELFEADSIEQQKEIYTRLEPRVVSKVAKWMMSRHLTLSLLGVPRPQRNLILKQYPGGMASYITDNLRHIFTELPIRENYFWYLYVKGHYAPDCAPGYLLKENFEHLKQAQGRINQYTGYLSHFLRENPDQYTHYVLLDHQDWLASHAPEALDEEWKLILENSRPGTKILLRSAAMTVDFFPDFVKERVKFKGSDNDETLQKLHHDDRVGTYGSVYFGEVTA